MKLLAVIAFHSEYLVVWQLHLVMKKSKYSKFNHNDVCLQLIANYTCITAYSFIIKNVLTLTVAKFRLL